MTALAPDARDRLYAACDARVSQMIQNGALDEVRALTAQRQIILENISEGVVAGIRHFPAGDYIQFSAPISPGSEGGALVDEQGRLVGVIDYRRRDGQNENYQYDTLWEALQ